jgi:hypothetical protein
MKGMKKDERRMKNEDWTIKNWIMMMMDIGYPPEYDKSTIDQSTINRLALLWWSALAALSCINLCPSSLSTIIKELSILDSFLLPRCQFQFQFQFPARIPNRRIRVSCSSLHLSFSLVSLVFGLWSIVSHLVFTLFLCFSVFQWVLGL